MPDEDDRTGAPAAALPGKDERTLSLYRRLTIGPLLGMIKLYRVTLSPFMGRSCRFQPTCSRYAEEALRRWGLVKGSWLMLRRIARCHPFGGQGYDPVP